MAAGDDDWDLSAVVRSCNSGYSAAASAAAEAEEINALSCLASLTFEDDPNDAAFSFSDIVFEPDDGFSELNQALRSFLPCPGPELTDPVPTRVLSEPEYKPIPPARSESKAVALKPRRWQPLDFSSPLMRYSRMPNSKKRKNQPKRTVCLVTVNDLTTDEWAWRKYGQKPIKGSPYPRNYYRCSSSKGCGARKQVERSNDDPNNFIITYTGDHSHPRPPQRSSLAGIPRNRLSPLIPIIKSTTGDLDRALLSTEVLGSCSSPIASPITSLNNDDDGYGEKAMAMIEHIVIDSDDDDDDDNILIPNLTTRDEIFVGFEKLGYSPRKRSSV